MVKTTFVVIFQIYMVMTTSCFFFVLYTCYITKYIFFWSGSSKNAIFFKFDNRLVVIKICIFLSGSSKKAIFLTFDHFPHSMCSSNSGHEYEKGGHMNPIVLYCTIDLWHIKKIIFLVRKLKKGNVFEF